MIVPYIYDGLGNAQALQTDGTPYDVTTFSNPNRSANWEFQQQFSGSVFNTGTQLLQYEGTDYAWSIFYQGQIYDGIPGVYQTPQGALNPRQAALLSPNPGMQLAGLSQYSVPQGFWGFYAQHEQGIAFGASAVAGAAVSIATWGLATPWVATALGVEEAGLGIIGTATLGAISGAAGGAASGFAYSATQGESQWQIAEATGENALFGGTTGGVLGAAGGLVGDLPGRATAAESETSQATSLWTRAEVNGLRVYQRSDLINPDYVSPSDIYGRTNLQRMQQGLAPYGPDDQPINLHHILQTNDSPLAEMTKTFHQQYGPIIHINPPSIPSGIDRFSFNIWRQAYWASRAGDFLGENP